MTLTVEPDLWVKLNHQAKYLKSKVISFKSHCPDTHTDQSKCSTWTTKVVRKHGRNVQKL